jgi:hypothetical protein
MAEKFSLSEAAPNRRQVICGVATLALAGVLLPPVSGALATVVVAETPPSGFLALSSRLTGVALDVVDQEQAARIWSALLPVFGQERLETVMRVAAGTPDDDALAHAFEQHGVLAVAQALTRTWYTGYWEEMPPAAGSNTVVPDSVLFYDAALAWTVCAFTKPAANCGGTTGYWEKPWQPLAVKQENQR